ncbi:cyanophycin synthetase [Chitinimonas sp. BJB300]|uniref:cyanophycin synthetase n=1 Tax=Chitinimonas sp. BJB300 TaxID=1559339 RepID=UPI001642FDFC|nr:cyanophycin synthetase [Chitinimonas sp. BJB300]
MKKNIEFLRVAYLGGPNIWTYRPVVEAWVDIGALEDAPSNTIPGFYERLTDWLPGLIEHRCGVGERGGFLQRLREGTWAGHIMEHVAIELQNLAGLKVGFGKARGVGKSHPGIYKVAVRARNEQVGIAAIHAARDLVMAAVEDHPYDVAATVVKLRDLIDEHHLGPSTAAIVDAAAERRIPYIRLNGGNLVQLGYGASQRRIWTAETDQTSAIAEGISSDKDMTKRLLRACGVPVPDGEVVDSPAAAWQAAQDIGLPVVIKPTDGNHGRGITLDAREQTDIEAAYHFAERHGSEVMVERFIPGNEHRLLVIGGKVVAAARGETAWVKGDGTSTVVELVERQLNSDPRRGDAEAFPLSRIDIDEDGAILNDLARQGLTADSVPAADQAVLIQRNGNVANEVSDLVHPDVAATVSLAARIVGLDIAGVDVVAEDIGRPLEEQGGAVVEVNAGPGLLMHLKPAGGEAQPVGRAIVDHLFPASSASAGRIPVVGVCGTEQTQQVARLVARLLQLSGLHTGLACKDGLFLDRRCFDAGDGTALQAGQRLLINRSVQAAVFENSAETILQQGLSYDRCNVGIVTDANGVEALSPFYINDEDQHYNVLRTQVDVVLPSGSAILNADDERVLELADLCDGEVILYGLDAASPAMVEHLAQGGRAVLVRAGEWLLVQGDVETRLGVLPVGRTLTPATLLAATAASWAMGLPVELIGVGIETFVSESNLG